MDDRESRAIARLIADIDALDAWRDRVGRRIIYLFAGTFLFAVTLLCWVVVFEGPPAARVEMPGPRVPGVMRSYPNSMPR